MTKWFCRRGRYLWIVLCSLLLASRARSQTPQLTDLDLCQLHAAGLKLPLLLLVAESDASRNDNRARALVASLAKKDLRGKCVVFSLDLAISRNRAMVGRFHVTNTPVLFYLSPKGIIISRDERTITKKTVLQRVAEAQEQSPEVDASLTSLETAVHPQTNDITAIFDLTDFLLAHQNDFEAIPYLTAVAHSDAYPSSTRTRAWVALAQAHLWIGEGEKGRHEAEDLIAALGPALPEAQSGGELVLGLQDAMQQRPTRARGEFGKAIAAAPESIYGKEATQALATLPGNPDTK
jgi:hypothetical protein